ncbi:MATE family efflux transporter [Lewinella sp. IMCC34183]|uniref:MATE family efflux transporter n=1 Tax=Lewinella sp. IMCC34183 TaxID=2248762 RepID=UPI0013003F3F|nr:MATE family efflux transporter [Lewinella sp. IMCC34183]
MWDWKLLATILAYQIFPSLYLSYRMYLVGNGIPGVNGLAIVSQWQFVQVLFEILQESLVLPIFYFVGSTLFSGNAMLTARRAAATLRLMALLVIPFALAIGLFADRFVEAIDTPVEILQETIRYLRLRALSLVGLALGLGAVIMLEALRARGALLRVLVVRLIASVLLDSYLFGDFEFSLALGSDGVALSSLLVETLAFSFALFELRRRLGADLFAGFLSPLRGDLAVFGRVGGWVAVDSAVRNVAYLAVVINLINAMGTGPIGGYYLCMFLFWTILLVPIKAIAETANVMFANHAAHPERLPGILRYSLLLGGMVLLGWAAVAAFAGPILRFFGNDPVSVSYATRCFYWLLGPYALLALNTIADSLFLGLGRTKYLAFQSLITNGTVYLIAYLLYWTGIWAPDLDSILLVFGLGIAVDSVLTAWYARRVLVRPD